MFRLNHLQSLHTLMRFFTEREREREEREPAASSVHFKESVHSQTTQDGRRLSCSPNYKDHQVPEDVRDYVSAPVLRPYIRHMPGCRSFFHSKGKAVSPSCYCRNQIFFHPCHRIKISVANYHFIITHVGAMSETRVL